MKKNILIAYPELFLGGSTTSLISLLKTIDYEKYNVDLFLFRKNSEYLNSIPKEVNILKEASKYKKNTAIGKIKFVLTYTFKGYFIRALLNEIKYKKKIGFNTQTLSQIAAKESKKIDTEYDTAIGYLEYWANDYILNYVNARKKIAWIHTDYLGAKFVPELDLKAFNKATYLVSVSTECMDNFKKAFPTLNKKATSINNIISSKLLLEKSNEIVEDFNERIEGLNIITVSRLSIFTKGYDRIVSATKKLANEGYKFKWFIIGDGVDRDKFKKIIRENGLEDYIVLKGKKLNPYPYIVQCDVFAMPSRYEGKPMAVTEAQILGLPIVITNYESASDQVINYVDGLVLENNNDSIYYGIKKILDDNELLKEFKKNLSKRTLSNEDEINKFYQLIE